MIRNLLAAAFVCLVASCSSAPAFAHGHHHRHHHHSMHRHHHRAARGESAHHHAAKHRHFRHRAQRPALTALGGGLIRSASGATAHVAASAAGAFQCLVSALDRYGYPIRFMGGWRAHGSVPHSKHPAGLALDINQLRRNVTIPAMPAAASGMAAACGLFHGALWNWADSGHFEVGGHVSFGRGHYRRHRHRG